MSRFKVFIENFLIYGLGGAISKMIPLIVLPIITRLMPDSFYLGINDLFTMIVSFGTSMAIMGMYDAMFRMFFEKNEDTYKIDICSSALAFVSISTLAVGLFLIFFRYAISQKIFGDDQYVNLVLLAFLSIFAGAINSITIAPIRMQNERKVYLGLNFLHSLMSYGITIFLLLNKQYILALPLGNIISTMIIDTVLILYNKRWFSPKHINVNYIKQMLGIGFPIALNFLSYWIFNSFDRLMIAKVLGNGYVGIYGVGAKVAQISQLIYVAFVGGWQFFSFSTMQDKDQVKMVSNIFEIFGIISFEAGMIMAVFSDMIFKTFFVGDYIQGSVVAPWLFMVPLMQLLYQIISNQFLIIKKTWPSMVIMAFGAAFNVCANCALIPKLEIEGAALATLMGYIITVVICAAVLRQMNLFHITRKFYVSTLLTLLFFLIWRTKKYGIILNIVIVFLISCFMAYLYRGILLKLVKRIKRRSIS